MGIIVSLNDYKNFSIQNENILKELSQKFEKNERVFIKL